MINSSKKLAPVADKPAGQGLSQTTRKFNFHVPGFQGVFLGLLFGNRIREK
jgi:hypothetical protein